MNKYQIFRDMTDQEYLELKEDIADRGVMVPIEYDEDGNILDGHHRLKACQELGIKEWPRFIRQGLTEFEKIVHIRKLNQARRHMTKEEREASWAEMRKEGMTYQAIAETDGTVSKSTVHEALKNHVSDSGNVPATITDTKGRKQPAKKPRKKKTNYVSAETAKKKENLQKRKDRLIEEAKEAITLQPIIIQCDCLEVIDKIPDIDLLLTDPPYFTNGDYTSYISAYLAKVKTAGQAYIFSSPDPNEVTAYLNMDRHHMDLEQILVWNYNNTGQRQPNNRYTGNYQVCFYFRGKDAEPINKPGDGTHQYACQTINAPDGRVGDRYHSWQKPIELIERLIRNSSKEGDFVFDPFSGSGTTLLAAGKLGRIAKGCDTDKDTIEISVKRGCVVSEKF